MDSFQSSARGLIARAVELARKCGAERVETEHLLLSASHEALEKAGLVEVMHESERPLAGNSPPRDVVEFAPQVLRLFQQAWLASEGRIEELHLLLCMELKGNGAPGVRLLNAEVAQRLEAAGIDVKGLVSEIGDLDVLSVRPEPDFWATRQGRCLVQLVSEARQPGIAGLAILMSCFMRQGPLAGALVRAGISEAGLMEMLLETGDRQARAQRLLASIPPVEGLDEAARVALAVAWECAQHRTVTAQHLLDGLLYADLLVQPGQGATAWLRSYNVVGFLHPKIKDRAASPAAEPTTPVLSEEVEKALALALSLSGTQLASTQHLLYGLASVGMEELGELGISAEGFRKTT